MPETDTLATPQNTEKIIQPSPEFLATYKQTNQATTASADMIAPETQYKDITPGDEINQRAALSAAYSKMGTSLAKETQANLDYKEEFEQLGKMPYERWYSHSWVGRDADKGIADLLFISLFGHSSATDTKRTKNQRAIIRVFLTIVVMGTCSYVWYVLKKPR